MPSYHSVFNKAEIHQKYCGIPVFEFKEKKTPTLDATKLKVDLKQIELDIIDEAIIYFRANVLFKNFNIDGDADKLLVYITVFIQKCLEKANDPNPAKAKENMKKLVDQCEYVPRQDRSDGRSRGPRRRAGRTGRECIPRPGSGARQGQRCRSRYRTRVHRRPCSGTFQAVRH